MEIDFSHVMVQGAFTDSCSIRYARNGHDRDLRSPGFKTLAHLIVRVIAMTRVSDVALAGLSLLLFVWSAKVMLFDEPWTWLPALNGIAGFFAPVRLTTATSFT
jgi:hypothetical protein